MTAGRTALLLKDKSKGNEVSNHKSITCLPLMWKLLTGIETDETYNHLEENGRRNNRNNNGLDRLSKGL